MNTVKSFWLGWGSVCVAGVGAYVFAKKEINADRQSKLEAHRAKKEAIRSLEYSENVPSNPGSASTMGNGNGNGTFGDNAASPSQEAVNDPAPTRHEPTNEQQRINEKSKYESSTPYRSRKGDRFS